jgi:putative transcriptional regulator
VGFDWDPAKSEATFRNRGFDFAYASRIFAGYRLETIDARADYGEVRIRAIGRVGPDILHRDLHHARLDRAAHLRSPGEQKGARPVALTRMTLEQIMARFGGKIDRAKLDATTEEDIRRHMIEDGEDPDEEPRFERVVLPQEVRKKLGMTQTEFSTLLRIPVATLRNWEQNRFVMEPAAQTLLKLIDREPEAALRALRGPRAA